MRKSTSTTFTHRWTIANFAHLYEPDCAWKWQVESTEFSAPNNESFKFILIIWPRERVKSEEYLGFGLKIKEIPTKFAGEVTVKERRYIIDEKGKKLYKNAYCRCRQSCDPEFVPLTQLKNYLRNGTLTVMTKITLHSPKAIFCLADNPKTLSTTFIPHSVSRLWHRLTIAHFKWLTQDSKRTVPLSVESEYFAPEREDGFGRMRLEFWPKGDKGTDEETVEIALRNDNGESVFLHYEIALLDRGGNKVFTEVDTSRISASFARIYSIPRRHLLVLLDSLSNDQLTIDCLLTFLVERNSDSTPPATPTTNTTHIDLGLFTFCYVPFTWTVNYFISKIFNQQTFVDSKIFSPPTDPRYEFSLCLYPKGDKREIDKQNSVTIALCLVSNCANSKIQWKCSIVDGKGNEKNSKIWSRVIDKIKDLGPFELISHTKLANFSRSLLLDDKLNIKCQLWIHKPQLDLPSELLNDHSPLRSRLNVTNITISHSQLTNSMLTSGSSITAGTITNTLIPDADY